MSSITELTCRVCLVEQQVLINVFDELDELQTNLSCLLDKCGDLQIEEDDMFPKYLCEECTRELLISAKFRDKCAKSKEILENVVKENTSYHDESESVSQIIEYSTEDEENDCFADVSEEVVSITEPLIEEAPESVQMDKTNLDAGQDIDGTIVMASKFMENLADTTMSYNENAYVEQIECSSVELSDNDNKAYEVDIDISSTPLINSLPVKGKHIKSFKCDICGAAFVQAINLQKHLQKTHSLDQCYTCAACDHWFSLEIELLNHTKYCQGSLDIVYSKGDIRKQTSETCMNNKNIEIQRSCTYCDREFQTPFALRMHLRTHTGERPFPCQYCDKAFKTQSSLNTHVKRHTGQADFICSFCGKSFYERGNLDVHMRSHTGERPHQCTICPKSFSRVFLLESHMRTHTGEKPFSCSFCEKSFRQRSDWKNHLTTHTGVKQYTCHLCSKGYIKRSSLAQHMRVHLHSTIDLDENFQVEQSETVPSFDILENEDVLVSE